MARFTKRAKVQKMWEKWNGTGRKFYFSWFKRYLGLDQAGMMNLLNWEKRIGMVNFHKDGNAIVFESVDPDGWDNIRTFPEAI